MVTVVTTNAVEYYSKHSLSCYFDRNATGEQLVYLFTVQPNKVSQ